MVGNERARHIRPIDTHIQNYRSPYAEDNLTMIKMAQVSFSDVTIDRHPDRHHSMLTSFETSALFGNKDTNFKSK